jgi:hypothetical protein
MAPGHGTFALAAPGCPSCASSTSTTSTSPRQGSTSRRQDAGGHSRRRHPPAAPRRADRLHREPTTERRRRTAFPTRNAHPFRRNYITYMIAAGYDLPYVRPRSATMIRASPSRSMRRSCAGSIGSSSRPRSASSSAWTQRRERPISTRSGRPDRSGHQVVSARRFVRDCPRHRR